MIGRTIAVAVVVAWLASPVLAVDTAVWESATKKDFDAGSLKQVVLDAEGTLQIGQSTKRLDSSAESLWSSVVGPKGTVYFGSGNTGLIYKLEGGKLETFFATEQLIVSSMAVIDGNLYAATLPNGKIFKIGPDGKGRTFAKLPDPYPWAMLVAGKSLVVATGPEGIVYLVTPDGKSTVVFDSGETNLLSLAAGEKGEVFAGSDKGVVLGIRPGKDSVSVRVVHTFPDQEVRCLVHSKDTLYAGVNESKNFDNINFVKSLARTIEGERSGTRTVDRKGLLKGLFKGRVARIKDGRAETLLAIDKDFITAMAVEGRSVLAAVGVEGRVYRVQGLRRSSTAFDVEESQVLTLVTQGGKLRYFGTGDGGKCYHVSDSKASAAEYLSGVHDAKFTARWGASSWSPIGKLSLETRSGNTPKPDNTWSAWSKPVTAETFHVTSPAARYLQYRIKWLEAGAHVSRVAIHYRVHNQRPVLTEFTVAGVGGGTKKLNKTANKQEREIKWKAADPDGDKLVFRLYYRTLTQNGWREVKTPKPLAGKTATKHVWKTGLLPDGRYQVMLQVTDAGSNVEGEALEVREISRPFLIDNTRPTLTGVTYRAGQISGLASDSFSAITRVEYAENGGKWRQVKVKDGMCDESREAFAFRISTAETGARAIAVRAYDAAGNMGIFQINVNVK